MYTATYGNNTLLREDLYGEPVLEGGLPYDASSHPNGGYSGSHYGSSTTVQTGHYGGGSFGGDMSQHRSSEPANYRRSIGQTIDSFVSAAYGGHATVARQPEKKYSPLFPDSLQQAGSTSSTRPPIMSLMAGSGSVSERRVVRVEGLPYHVTIPQILEFFHGYDVGYDAVRIQCRDDGSPSGKAFITFPSERHALLASQQLNKRYIGDRYVELYLV
jgi:hypothetical protein